MRSTFLTRRLINSGILVFACILALVLFQLSAVSFYNPSEWTGWLLVSAIVCLLFYAVRKRLSGLPLGRMSTWLQAHLYIGFFSIFVLVLHLDWSVPNGWFAMALAFSFVGVALTGVLGITWSRTLPSLITALGDEVMHERISVFSKTLRIAAEENVLNALRETGSKELANFYQTTGHAFFANPTFQWSRLYKKHQPRRKIERELNTLRRYVADHESHFVDEMHELVKKKDLLNAHYTFQGALRYWLFVHLAFALSLIPLALIHIVLVYNFSWI